MVWETIAAHLTLFVWTPVSSAMAEFPLCGARLEVSLLADLTLDLIY